MPLMQLVDRLQHVGIPAADPQGMVDFLKRVGFAPAYARHNVTFLAAGQLMLEVWEDGEKPQTPGKIEHLALNVPDVEAAFALAKREGFEMVEDGIQFLPFWDNGVRFFTLKGPEGLLLEFNQKL